MNATTNTIQQTAMLFTLSIKQWSGKASDKGAARQLASDKSAVSDCVKVSKQLVFSQLTDDIKKLANEARQEFYALTLPWMDDGRRLLSAKNYNKAMAKMAQYQASFEKLAAQVESQYPIMIDEARKQLGDLFLESDYPKDITKKYAFAPHVEPIPSVDDIRVGLGEGERAKIAAELKAQIEAAGVNAKRDIYERAADCVKRIAEALPKFDPKASGKERGTFRDSLIGNVADLLDGLDGLNFDNDQSVIALGDRLRSLTVYEPEALREDASKRAQVSSTASEILEMMQGYTGMTAPTTPTVFHGQSAA
jgi:hypothetical protein